MSRARDLADYVSTGVTSTELDKLDGLTATTDELNLVDGSVSGPLSHRNLIINGAMQVAQRGTSATVNGFGTVDRFKTDHNGVNENTTQAQHTLTSSDTGPYEEGFRYSFHITNGNQTSGADAIDRIIIPYIIEAQDIANSGWNYISTSSYITLSFWCKSSVAQNFYGRLQTSDGTAQNYVFETGSLSANTWTKITKTIPGNSNLQFDNNNEAGLTIEFNLFRGTDTTGSVTLNTWATYNASTRVPDMTSTWYTTNDATWEITGVQLERGQVATPFEHRTYADELQRCERYCQTSFDTGVTPAYNTSKGIYSTVPCYQSGYSIYAFNLSTPMRTTPSVDFYCAGNQDTAAGHWSFHDGSWHHQDINLHSSTTENIICCDIRTGTTDQALLMNGQYIAFAEF